MAAHKTTWAGILVMSITGLSYAGRPTDANLPPDAKLAAQDFVDHRWGWIGHGNVLSDTGRVVARNSELLASFGPIEDLADFGLDGLQIFWPFSGADLD